MNRRLALCALFLLTFSISVFAQSVPLATLTGKVTADNAALPGVTVTVTSPNLQGSRTAVTTANGDYLIALLPPGEYTVTFELSGMQTVKRKATLTAARAEHLDMAMRPEAVSEAITVTAETPMTAAVEGTQVSTNFKQDMIEMLPVTRTLTSVTLMAPGVTPNGPGGNVMISGAMSFDSLFMVNGAIISENLRGQPHSLFIEDAIQETTVLTGAVPAEYGNFTGGVVNAITKSGGNDLKGSFRTSFTNESWSAKTPFTVEQDDTINDVYEATLGGPFLRDRLWFFGAGRFAELSDIRQTVPGLGRSGDQFADGTPIPVGTQIPPITYPHSSEETRLEGKLTGSLFSKHTFVASYMDIAASEQNQTGQSIMDLDSLVPERETPNTFFALNYAGTLTNNFYLEGQYSKKDFKFVGSGSTFYDVIKGTLITDRARGTRYWSPTFRNTPEGEERDIETLSAKATYFLSNRGIGSHEFRLGFEDFNEVRKVNNWQNGSEYRISVPNTIVRGNVIYPRMPGGAGSDQTRISWLPIFVLSQGSDYTRRSVYLTDNWSMNEHWTFNLGVRYDKNDALSGDRSFQISDDSVFLPRLAAHYDIFGNGRIVLNASYSHYNGRLAEGAANDADPAGRNASLQWSYQGPSINNTATAATLVPTDQAIKQVMDWFFANGGHSRRPFRTTPSLPGVESILDPAGLPTPLVKEMTVGVGSAIGTRGYARADVIFRDWENFYTSYRNTGTGKVTDTRFGTNSQYDLSIIRSNSDLYEREYTAVQTQFSYRMLRRLTLGGTYTWSRLIGNVTGEDSGSGPLVGNAGEYPEYRRAEWNYPTGYLTGDQRHRAKVWGSWDLPTRFGEFNLSAIQNFDSGTRTSVDGSVDTRPFVTNPGYLTPPSSVSYFFGGRGNLSTDDITRTDLSINYKLRVFGSFELFVQPEIINVFNEQGVTSYDEEVLTALDCTGTSTQDAACPAGGLPRFNPFTETPVEGTHYMKGPNFGLPNSEGDYQTPRTFRVSVGLRF